MSDDSSLKLPTGFTTPSDIDSSHRIDTNTLPDKKDGFVGDIYKRIDNMERSFRSEHQVVREKLDIILDLLQRNMGK